MGFHDEMLLARCVDGRCPVELHVNCVKRVLGLSSPVSVDSDVGECGGGVIDPSE